MSYEKDLDYLKRELRNAQNIYDEAEKDERESDAEMWMNSVTHLEFQIEVFEKATKSDEYEAKAKAWDKYKAHMESHIAGEVNEEEFVSDLKSDYFESGDYDAKK